MCNKWLLDSFSFTKETFDSYIFFLAENKIGLAKILLPKLGFAEAATGSKKLFSKFSQNSQEHTCIGVSFLNKVAGEVFVFLNIMIQLVLTFFMPLGSLKTSENLMLSDGIERNQRYKLR